MRAAEMVDPELDSLWQLLHRVRTFQSTVVCGPRSKTGWTGKTEGTVDVRVSGDGALIDFVENGTLHTDEGKSIQTTNHWQWTRTATGLSLAHCRRGEPVLLAELSQPNAEGTFISSSPHLCGADVYVLKLLPKTTAVELHWHIQGPKKDETLRILYTTGH